MSYESIWIPGYVLGYYVNGPDVFSVKRNIPPARLTPYKDCRGYLRVNLYDNGKLRAIEVHRLVALCYLGPCPGGMEVLHGPGGKQDNRPENLRYGTHQENMDDYWATNPDCKGERNNFSKLTDEKVLKIRELHKDGVSRKALAERFNISVYTVTDAVTYRTWKHI